MSRINSTNQMSKYMARALLELKSATAAICFFNTVWNGIPVMITWNPLHGNIIDCYGCDLSDDDFADLHDVIVDYYLTEGDNE